MLIKNIRWILITSWIIIGIVCSVLLYLTFCPDSMEEEMLVCGNSFPEDNILFSHSQDTTFNSHYDIFQMRCASCHNPIRDATGPAFVDIVSSRSNEWICSFVTDLKFKPDDKLSDELRKYYGFECPKFPKLTCEEVDAIVKYVDYYK